LSIKKKINGTLLKKTLSKYCINKFIIFLIFFKKNKKIDDKLKLIAYLINIWTMNTKR